MKPRSALPALLLVAACTDLTAPPSRSRAGSPAPARAAAHRAAPEPAPAPPRPAAAEQETIAASHVLVAYKGALRARPEIQRTKDEAETRAALVVARARKGDDFAKLAREISDDPGGKRNGGDLGRFNRKQMVKAFSDAAFALKPGEISDVVESAFGFHVIKRTE